MPFFYTKDPYDRLDYVFNYQTWLAGDSLLSSVWSVEAGIDKISDTHTGSYSVIWLENGTLGNVYTVSNTITTVAGRTKKVCMEIKITGACE